MCHDGGKIGESHACAAAARSCDDALVRVFAFLGKRWNGVLIGTLADGPAGFAELGRALPGISESVLSDRLNELTTLGLISRTVREGPPIGVSYQLTERGQVAGARHRRPRRVGPRPPARTGRRLTAALTRLGRLAHPQPSTCPVCGDRAGRSPAVGGNCAQALRQHPPVWILARVERPLIAVLLGIGLVIGVTLGMAVARAKRGLADFRTAKNAVPGARRNAWRLMRAATTKAGLVTLVLAAAVVFAAVAPDEEETAEPAPTSSAEPSPSPRER